MADDKHKVRNAVIASLTTAAIISLVVYLIPGGWAWIVKEGKSVIGAVVLWLGSSLAVPAWLVVILSLIAVIVIIAVAVVAVAVMRKSDDSIESFTESDFFGVKWRWRYGQHGIYSITSYCPVCDLQVYPRHTSSYSSIERMVYRCDNGHWESQELEGSQAQIENRIEREIHRQLRKKEEDAKRKTA